MKAQKNTPDAFMMDYHPYYKGKNPKHTFKTRSKTLSYAKQQILNSRKKQVFLTIISKWIVKEFKKMKKDSIVIAIVPGHKKSDNPSGFVHEVVDLQEKTSHDKILLIRTKTVSKSSQTPGPRSKAKHEGTIEVKAGSPGCAGRVVVILDDIWTSGSTLNVCEDVIRDKYPRAKDVKLFAFGKTVSMTS